MPGAGRRHFLTGLHVVRELEAIVARRGRPATCVSDNGTELNGMAVLRWWQEIRMEWHYIAPGKPSLPTATGRGAALCRGLRGPPRCVSEPIGLRCHRDFTYWRMIVGLRSVMAHGGHYLLYKK